MTTTLAENKSDKIETLRQRLERLISDGAPEHEIAMAQNKLAAARHRAQRHQERLQERAEIARGLALKKHRETEQQREEAARKAEHTLRTGPMAPTITVAYSGLRFVFTPELVSDHVIRGTARHALQQALVILERHFEAAVGAARASAKRIAAPVVMPAERLRLSLEDLLRIALKHGTVTITEIKP
jgi:hypothetical protein